MVAVQSVKRWLSVSWRTKEENRFSSLQERAELLALQIEVQAGTASFRNRAGQSGGSGRRILRRQAVLHSDARFPVGSRILT